MNQTHLLKFEAHEIDFKIKSNFKRGNKNHINAMRIEKRALTTIVKKLLNVLMTNEWQIDTTESFLRGSTCWHRLFIEKPGKVIKNYHPKRH